MKMKLWALQVLTLLLIPFTFVQTFSSEAEIGRAETTPTDPNPGATSATEASEATPETPATSGTPAITTDGANSEKPETVTQTTNAETPAATTNVISTPSMTTEDQDVFCAGKDDFEPCRFPENTKCNGTGNSKCSCKNKKHFCRCNNDQEKWYIGENCDQEWTVLTFALVASLPGVGLAIIVGVAVHFVNHSRKKGKAAKVKSNQKVSPHPSSSKKESSPEDGYSNLVFASDLQSGQKPQPESGRPSADNIPMGSQPYRPQSYAFDQPSRNQSYKNPYTSSQPSRNPYDSLDKYDGYRNPMDPPAGQNGFVRGNQSGYQQAGPPAPLYSSPDYSSSRSQLPRVQVFRQY